MKTMLSFLLSITLAPLAALKAEDVDPQRYVDQGKVIELETVAVASWQYAQEADKEGDTKGFRRHAQMAISCISFITMANPLHAIPPKDEMLVRRVSSDMRKLAADMLASKHLDDLAKMSYFTPQGFEAYLKRTAEAGSWLFDTPDEKQKEIDSMSDLIAGKKVADQAFIDAMIAANDRLKSKEYDQGPAEDLEKDIKASHRIIAVEPIQNLAEIPAPLYTKAKADGCSDALLLHVFHILDNPVTHTLYAVIPGKNPARRLTRILTDATKDP